MHFNKWVAGCLKGCVMYGGGRGRLGPLRWLMPDCAARHAQVLHSHGTYTKLKFQNVNLLNISCWTNWWLRRQSTRLAIFYTLLLWDLEALTVPCERSWSAISCSLNLPETVGPRAHSIYLKALTCAINLLFLRLIYSDCVTRYVEYKIGYKVGGIKTSLSRKSE